MNSSKTKSFYLKGIFSVFMTLIGMLAPFGFYLFEDFHYFITEVVPGTDLIVLFLSVLSAAYSLFYLWRFGFGKSEKKALRVLRIICFIISFIVVAVDGFYFFSLQQCKQVFRTHFFEEIAWIAFTFGTVTFALSGKYFKKKYVGIILAAVLAVTSAAGIFGEIFDLTKFELVSAPAVFDNGNGYLVVWAANENSVGYIEYTFDGKDYKVYDETYGRIETDSLIHTVRIPYEQLKNNSYKVSCSRVLTSLAYGTRTGKTVSFTASFNGNFEDKINMTVLTDNHNVPHSYYKEISEENTDVLVCIGDFSDMITDEKTICDNLLYPCGTITNGEVPVIFAKGNHENRGKACNKLSDVFLSDPYYYQAYLGDYRITVFDSGEDKLDSHKEMAGITNFEPYRKAQLEWLDSMEKEYGKYDIAICHIPAFSPVDEETSAFSQGIEKMGCDLLLSGHHHKAEFTAVDYRDIFKLPVFVCGGVCDGTYVKKDLAYTTLTLDSGTAYIAAKSHIKGVLFSEEITLTK